MRQIVAVANLKGGVGKTTLTLLLARYFSLQGKSVLVIDADPQGSATQHYIDDELVSDSGIIAKGIHVLLNSMIASGSGLTKELVISNLHHVIPRTEEAYWLLPNFIPSSYYDTYLITQGLHLLFMGRILEHLNDFAFDVVFIDCPPYVNAFTLSSLVVANHLIVPVEATPISVVSANFMFETVAKYIRDGLIKRETLREITVVPTKVRRTTAASASLKQMKRLYGDYVTENFLPFTESMNKFYAQILSVQKIVNGGGLLKKIAKLLEELKTKIEVENE